VIAVITAGGTIEGVLGRRTMVKAMLPWEDALLVDRVLDVALRCEASRVAIVGDGAVRSHCSGRVDLAVASVDDGAANLELALNCAEADEALLLFTSDLPFITLPAVRDFLDRIGPCDIAMPLTPGACYERVYPNSSPHVTRLGSEHVANGNLFYFASGSVARRALAVAQQLFRTRKSRFEMAKLFDMGLMLRYLTRTLEIGHIERYAHRRFNLRAQVVRDCHPSLCYDIDTAEDYRYALNFRPTPR
jgi:CTP:molybdopterin cytidylyltransferase MocA